MKYVVSLVPFSKMSLKDFPDDVASWTCGLHASPLLGYPPCGSIDNISPQTRYIVALVLLHQLAYFLIEKTSSALLAENRVAFSYA